MSASDESSNDKVLEKKLDSLQNLIEKQLQKDEPKKNVVENKTVKKEDRDEDENSNVRFLKLLYNTMLENEITETYANQIIDELDSVIKPNMPIDFMLSNVYQKMILKFEQPEGITLAKKGPKVVFFVQTHRSWKDHNDCKNRIPLFFGTKEKGSLVYDGYLSYCSR